MRPEDEKSNALDVLNYWHCLDFMSQDALPKPKKGPEFKFQKDRQVSSVSDVFDPNAHGDISPGSAESGDASCGKRLNGFIEKRLSSRRGFSPEQCFTYLHLGAIPREAFISYFEDGESDGHARPERETDKVSAALLKISPEGKFEHFELSPLLWAVGKKSTGGKIDVSEYESENREINEGLADYFGKKELGLGSVEKIVEKHVGPRLKRLARDGQLDEGRRRECLGKVLFDYRASTRDGFSYEISFRSFFSKDIGDLRSCIEKADRSDLENEQLSLALHYLGAGFGGESGAGGKTARIDILSRINADEENSENRQLQFYRQVLGYDSIPLGRWPSKYPLSLMQQTAVDLVAGRNCKGLEFPVNDIMSVNGPPGTGKTTLLKDIIAANVVEKARLLSEYDDPDDAFEKVKLSREKGYLRYANGVYKLKDEKINDLGIIVCSSNNAAVENISKELPDAKGLFDGIDKSEKDEMLNDDLANMLWADFVEKGGRRRRCLKKKRDLYFSYAAFNQFEKKELQDYDDGEDSNLHLLLAARLGNKSNIYSFRGALKNVSLGKSSDKGNYEKARKQFKSQYEKVQKLFSDFSFVLDEVEHRQRELDGLEERIEELDTDARQEQAAYRKALEQGLGLAADASGAAEVRLEDKTFDGLENFAEKLEGSLACYEVEWRHLEDMVARAEKAQRAIAAKKLVRRKQKKLAEATKDLEDARYKRDLFAAAHRNENKLAEFADKLRIILGKCKERLSRIEELRRTVDSLSQDIAAAERDLDYVKSEAEERKLCMMGEDAAYPSITDDFIDDLTSSEEARRKKAHLFNPAAGKELMRERDLLFLKALQFTREFILSSSNMKANLEYLCAYWGQKKKGSESDNPEIIKFDEADKKAMASVLFQTLNVLTPVISTTFASVQSMFADVAIKDGEKAPFGLLIIDEAGQAVPYAALGILSRCRKAMVVGDPFQVEPVVCQEAKALRRAMARDIDLFYKGDTASVQKFADALNPYGQERSTFEDGREESSWVGCPLVVHRRCVSPMFDISNEVSYQGSMLNETPLLNPDKPGDKEKLDSFYLPSSQWLNVKGSEVGDKDHYVEKQGERVCEIVRAAFEKRTDEKAVPSLFIISPFKTVVKGVREALKAPDMDDGRLWEEFRKHNIGTVHTFQGKEALEVVFVLGCDAGAPGAVQFVNSNIVNVAASRAKQRLYVVGDFMVWKENEHVRKMKQILDTAWVKHWENYLAAGEEEELRLARQMLPVGESLPFDEVEVDAGSTGGKERVYDTDPYLENMSELTDRLLRDERNDPAKYGFPSMGELENVLGKCVSDDGNNRVLSNIKQGILLYEMFACEPEKVDDNFDLSFVLKMFDKAVELYVNLQALPALKKVVPEYGMPKKQRLENCEKVTIGQYGRIVGTGLGTSRLAWGAKEIAGMQKSPCADEGWWKALSAVVGDFAATRNRAAHIEPVGLDDVNEALGCMGIKEGASLGENDPGAPAVTILKSEADDVYAALAEEDFDGVDFSKFEAAKNLPPRSSAMSPEPATQEPEIPNGAPSGFSLADAESTKGDCNSATTLLKDDRFAELHNDGFNATKIFDWLEEKGMIEKGAINGASGRVPTEAGANVGIRWRRFENEGKKPSTGIYFNSDAQQWLAQNIGNLLEWKKQRDS